MDSRKIIKNAVGCYFSNEDLIEFLTIITPESHDLRLELVQKIYKYNIKANTAISLTEYLKKLPFDFFINKIVADCYEDYCIWCTKENLEPKSKAEFSRAVSELFNLQSKVTTVDGKRVRVYRAV